MKAAVYTRYGPPDVVTIAEVPKPTAKNGEVLIRIRATTVSTGDWRARSLVMPAGFGLMARLVFGLFRPRKPVLGTELSGAVEAVGPGVTRFKIGDKVFAFAGAAYGCHAEYRTMPEAGLIAAMPANLTFEEAAALCFGGVTALPFLRDKGRIKRGDNVLVVGASGAVGSAAVQIAKHFGARVTGVCGTANVDLVRSIGADSVIDYTREDFAANGETYDIILDTTATVPLARCEASLKAGGRLLVVNGTFGQAIGLERPARGSGKKVIAGVQPVTADDIAFLAKLAAAGEYRPVIDKVYPLEKIAEAHAYVDKGHKRGSVVIAIGAAARSMPSK